MRMLGWAFAFFIAALIAATFGFGGMANAFSGVAVLMFWIFAALLALSLVAGVLTRAHGHRFADGGRTALVIAATAVIAILAYAWVDNDWTAQQAGREVDRAAAELAANTGDAIEAASTRTGDLIDAASAKVRRDAVNGVDESAAVAGGAETESETEPAPTLAPR